MNFLKVKNSTIIKIFFNKIQKNILTYLFSEPFEKNKPITLVTQNSLLCLNVN